MHIAIPQRLLAITLPPDQFHFDPFLGVPDRFGLGSVIEQVQQQAHHHAIAASYFVIGIDRMRLLQQVFGLAAGQAILLQAVQILQQAYGDTAHICWLGGDMLAVVLLHDPASDTAIQAATLLARFRAQHSGWPQDAHVTVSIGAVPLTGVALAPHQLIAAGESALQEAKQAGRNGFAVYDRLATESQQDQQQATLHTARQVQRALHDHALSLAFQPVICSKTGRVMFYEALARMKDPAGQSIAAAHFMPAVEQFGLSYVFDCHVLDLAIVELQAQPDLQLAINIAASTSENPAWPDRLEHVLRERRDLAARLIIEITESVQIRDMARTRYFVDCVHALGGKVALDDFGAGYTTVQHLTGLPIQIMKLDRALVHDVHKHPQQQEVLLALIALARSLGLAVVAEGVEDAAVAAWLSAAKVELQQGYYHGHPQIGRPERAA